MRAWPPRRRLRRRRPQTAPTPSSRPRAPGCSPDARWERPATATRPSRRSNSQPAAFEASGATPHRDAAERELRKLGRVVHRRTREGHLRQRGARRAERARARGGTSRGGPEDEQADRRGAVREPQDGRGPHAQPVPEARRSRRAWTWRGWSSAPIEIRVRVQGNARYRVPGRWEGGRVATGSRYEAVLFDLDGVLTSTAALHARCWKLVFDDVLNKVRGQTIEVDISHEETTYRLLEGRGLPDRARRRAAAAHARRTSEPPRGRAGRARTSRLRPTRLRAGTRLTDEPRSPRRS